MWQHIAYDWVDPLEMAAGIPASAGDFVLLHSGLEAPFTGRYSLLALYKDREVVAEDFKPLEPMLTTRQPTYENAWFGYFGYGLKNVLEELPHDKAWHIALPNLHMATYKMVIRFDHRMKQIDIWAKSSAELSALPAPKKFSGYKAPKISKIDSDMTKKQYLKKVTEVQEAILRGDIYQANLTRKFTGLFEKETDAFALFTKLCAVSPAPYSAFLRLGDTAILSSSPERLLTLTAEGMAESRPIKGSAPRGHNVAEDIFNKEQLQASTKNRSENLMIVDLMRNDISRGCEIGSVRVSDLYDITSYSTIHHMSSAVQGKKRAEVSPLQLAKYCFPPGSMTGAPKIEAMRLCSTLEPYARGIYSGAIGYFGGDGTVDLSVVIRTLVIQGTRFEFQVGGGIVEDSTPEDEWRETMTKARGIAGALGLSLKELEGI